MAGVFVEEPTSRLSVKIPINEDGNIAQIGEVAVKQKSVSIKGFVDNGSLSQANDVFEAFLGDIANTNYDSLSAVRYDTAKVSEGQSQNLRANKEICTISSEVGSTDTATFISAVPTDTALSLTFTPANPENFSISVSGRTATFTRTATGEFETELTVTSGEVAGYASATTSITIIGS